MLWLIDLLLVIPAFFLIAIVTRSAESSSGSWWLLVILLAAFAWPLSARVVRSATLSLREREYVLAARYLGASPLRIITTHLLPNASSLLIIDATLGWGTPSCLRPGCPTSVSGCRLRTSRWAP